jgi:hypothetical protein
MKLGYKQLRAIEFLKRTKKPTHFSYKGKENRRIVDSLERRGIVDVFRYSPELAKDTTVLVALNANYQN